MKEPKISSLEARGTFLLLGQSACSGLFRIFNILILTRLLFPSEMGQIAIMAIIFGFMQFIGALGLNHIAPWYIPKAVEERKDSTIPSFFYRSLLIISICSFCLSVILFLFSPFITMTGILSFDILLLLIIVAPLSSLDVFLDSFLLARYRVKHLSFVRILYDIVKVISTVLLVVMGFGILGVAIGWVLSEFIAVIFYFYSSTRGLVKSREAIAIGPILALALPNLIFQFIDVVIQSTDRVILLILTDLTTLGVYDVILSVLFMMSFVSIAIATSIYPVLSKIHYASGVEDNTSSIMSQAIGRVVRYVIIFLLPLAMIAAINSARILQILFNTSYSSFPDAALSFSILVLSYVVWGVVYGLHSSLRSLGEAKFFAWSGLIIIVFELIGSWCLVSVLGLLGSAIIRSIYITLLFLMSYGRLHQKDITFLKSISSPVIKITFASFLSGILVLLAPPELVYLIIAIFLSLVIYAILIIFSKVIDSEDLRIAMLILPASFRRPIAFLERFVSQETEAHPVEEFIHESEET